MNRAAATAGGVAPLAKRLGYSEILVRAWMAGKVAPPESVFFKAVSILADLPR
jgi:hypothetical protein